MSATHTEPTSAVTDDGLFDRSQYDLPIPEKDGHKADLLRLAVGGSINLDLYDEHALEFFNGLRLGRDLELTVTFTVSGSAWRNTVKGEDEQDHVVHQITLTAHSIDIPTSQ
jgi:hypothetical protein